MRINDWNVGNAVVLLHTTSFPFLVIERISYRSYGFWHLRFHWYSRTVKYRHGKEAISPPKTACVCYCNVVHGYESTTNSVKCDGFRKSICSVLCVKFSSLVFHISVRLSSVWEPLFLKRWNHKDGEWWFMNEFFFQVVNQYLCNYIGFPWYNSTRPVPTGLFCFKSPSVRIRSVIRPISDNRKKK